MAGFEVVTVSAITKVERTSPLVIWVRQTIARLAHHLDIADAQEFSVEAFSVPADATAAAYPLRQLLWIPFKDLDGQVIGGMLQARLVPWSENEITISRHLAGAYAHALMAMAPRTTARWWPAFSRRTLLLSSLAIVGLAAFPVSMSALAPVEVAPRRRSLSQRRSKNLMLEQVLVDPSNPVIKGAGFGSVCRYDRQEPFRDCRA